MNTKQEVPIYANAVSKNLEVKTNNKGEKMYIIIRTYYYFDQPNKGYAIKDAWGDIVTFKTKQDALDYLNHVYGPVSNLQSAQSHYSQTGLYELRHNEHARPTFQIRKHNKGA
tara:strand:+ start:207 stop:545 length:339 start_codon:yes stop_codon:yes gene_type:complete